MHVPHNQYDKVLVIPRIDLFFTWWALIAHVLFICGFFYNTTTLAIFVCVIAEVINFTINKEYNVFYNILAHYTPLILLLVFVKFEIDFRPIIILLFLYLLYNMFNIQQILKYYERPSIYFFQ
jgi:hypothetical protein